ncbi:respiratory nitrate reductase subunit gamma [Caldovatus aquaticus]|uniref:Respiratory nitrate reductase subunit gamma n=1 Tax=Caldovatus aquaticus TaxID=2865671 RepID=A0ABS7F1L7_9PROT|nr:respiratory nitrate reductase subunit gamma [Caldovatus aquaticus]MBW8268867.1 respiratory nitrate reductase subunit gamma [Caldovatus aquaticus]
MSDFLHTLAFGIYPYIALTVFLLGSLVRFEREQYSWRSGSSQLLRARQLRVGSNLFHIGILFLLFGHTVGLLTPHEIYSLVITAEQKQMLAIVSGGIAGVVCFVGLTMLLHRRLYDPRIRKTSSAMDIAVLVLLWLQLVLGLATIPFSLAHRDGQVMMQLSHWAQHILTFRADAASFLDDVGWVFKAHLLLGMTLFVVFPFSRLVHIWSAPVGYVFRPYQLVRRRGGARTAA